MNRFFKNVHRFGLQKHRSHFEQQLARLDADLLHGQRQEWEALLNTLSATKPTHTSLTTDCVTIGEASQLTDKQQTHLKNLLLQFYASLELLYIPCQRRKREF